MQKFLLSLLAFSTVFFMTATLHAEVKKFQVKLPDGTTMQREVRFIERVNYGTPTQAEYVGNQFLMNRIIFRAVNDDPNVTFMPYRFRNGDEVLFNTDEVITRRIAEDKTKKAYQKDDDYFDNSPIAFEEKQIVPCIVFTKLSREKKYGWCFYPTDDFLVSERYRSADVSDLTDYDGDFNGFTLLYAVLPRDRLSTGTLKIKHKGEWIKDSEGNIWALPILGLSRTSLGKNKNDRIDPNANTPQGIYRIEGVMKNEENLELGDKPYLDIDSAWLPVGAAPHNLDTFIMSEIIDRDYWNDYWINEYALGHAVTGRNLLRIHGNSKDPREVPAYVDANTKVLYRPTQGCLNTAEGMQPLLDILIDLDAITLNYDNSVTFASGKKKFWNKSKKIGQVFLIVKDADE
jgi:hypothetical protein